MSLALSVQELQGLETFIDADHSNFIHVQNVYESILLQTLDKEVTKGMRVLTSDTDDHKSETHSPSQRRL